MPSQRIGTQPASTPAAANAADQFKDRRLIVLFFDLSAMEPDEIDRAINSAEHYVDTQMAPADLVSIVSLGSSLLVNQDFTSDHELLKKQLQAFGEGSGQGFEEGTTGTTEGTPDTGSAVHRGRYGIQHLQHRPAPRGFAVGGRETFSSRTRRNR